MIWLLVLAAVAAAALAGGGAAPAQAPPPKKPGFPAPGGGEVPGMPDVSACLDDNLPPAIRDQIAGLLQQASTGTVASGALLAAANIADQFQAPKAAACLRKAAAAVPAPGGGMPGGGVSGLTAGVPGFAQSASVPFAPMLAAAGATILGGAGPYKVPAQSGTPQPGSKPLNALPTGVTLDPSRDWFTWITDCVAGLPAPYRDIMWLGLDRAWKGQLSEDQMNAAWNQMTAMGYPKVATCIENVRDEAVAARDANLQQQKQLAALKAAGF